MAKNLITYFSYWDYAEDSETASWVYKNGRRVPGYGSDYACPNSMINWNAFTHMIIGGIGSCNSSVSPYFTPMIPGNAEKLAYEGFTGLGYDNLSRLVATAHQHNVKVLTVVGAVDPGEGFNTIVASTAMCNTFCQAIADYCTEKNLDGVDCDIESWTGRFPTRNQLAYFLETLRSKLGPTKVIASSPDTYDPTMWPVTAVNTYVDMFNYQQYGADGCWDNNRSDNASYWTQPLTNDGKPDYIDAGSIKYGGSTSASPQGYAYYVSSLGYDINKLGMLLLAGGHMFKGTSALYQAFTAGRIELFEMEVRHFLPDSGSGGPSGGTSAYSSQYGASCISGKALANWTGTWHGGDNSISAGENFFIGWLTPQSLSAIVNYGNSVGLQNYGLYAIDYDTEFYVHSALMGLLNGTTSNPDDLSFLTGYTSFITHYRRAGV